MGGGRKQFQVLVDPDELAELRRHAATTSKQALAREQSERHRRLSRRAGAERVPGPLAGPRQDGRRDLQNVVVKAATGGRCCSSQVARVVEGGAGQARRQRAFAATRRRVRRRPGRLLTINKQPGADTRLRDRARARRRSRSCSRRCRPTSASIPTSTSRRTFIDLAIDNVIEALRDGGILVVIILFLFLLNFRTTFITLTAIPLSIVITALVFKWFGMSINTMTLGGLAVAIGELVDDAIVDVENIFRRLRENRHSAASQAAAAGRLSRPAARSATRSCSARSSWCWCSCRCSPCRAWKAGCSRRWASPTSCRSWRRWWCRSR